MHFNGKSESEARAEILSLVKEYCDSYHNQKKWREGAYLLGFRPFV